METGHFSSEICRLVFSGLNSIGPSFAASCMSQSNRALITQTQLKGSNLCVCSRTQLCAQEYVSSGCVFVCACALGLSDLVVLTHNMISVDLVKY